MSMPSRRTPDPFAVQVGKRLRKLREQRKMSLSALAKASGISRGHLSDLERGKVVMAIGTLARLADALRVPPFSICLVPKNDPQVAVIDQALVMAGGDVQKAAELIRELILEFEQKNGDPPDEDGS
jgi:transcriptional regulator with XRE-family HTH domain